MDRWMDGWMGRWIGGYSSRDTSTTLIIIATFFCGGGGVFNLVFCIHENCENRVPRK